MVDFKDRLGSEAPIETTQLTLFIPSVDRDGRPIDQVSWVAEALALLGLLFRGATAFPPGRGVWRDDEREGRLVFDATVVITSYLERRLFTPGAETAVLGFLRRLGRDGRQGEVGALIDGKYYRLTSFEEKAE